MAYFFQYKTLSFFDDRVPTLVPEDAVEISVDVRNALMNTLNSGGSIEFSGGEFQQVPAPLPDIETVKVTLKNNIDCAAETERLKYITPGVGQSMTYQEKVNQASNYAKAYAAYLNDPENVKAPNENEYLLLKSSLGIDGDTLAEVAETVTWVAALWEPIGAAIETIRLQTKAAIDAATTAEDAQAIFDAVKWP